MTHPEPTNRMKTLIPTTAKPPAPARREPESISREEMFTFLVENRLLPSDPAPDEARPQPPIIVDQEGFRSGIVAWYEDWRGVTHQRHILNGTAAMKSFLRRVLG